MSIRNSIACFFFLVILQLAGAAESATQTVSLQELPPAVQAQVKRQLGNAALGEIERERDNDETTYIVSLTWQNDEETYFTVAEDGLLLAAAVQLKELPANIQQAIKAQLANGTLDNIEKTFDEGETNYDVTFTKKDGQERSFTIDSKGTLTSVQVALAEVPASVRQT